MDYNNMDETNSAFNLLKIKKMKQKSTKGNKKLIKENTHVKNIDLHLANRTIIYYSLEIWILDEIWRKRPREKSQARVLKSQK